MDEEQQTTAKQKNDWTQLEEEFASHHVGATPTQSTKKVVGSRSSSTQDTLLIAEIRDGVVILKDGSFKAVVRVRAVNFDLMSQEERESVEYAYQGFLNSLYFPIQISIQSRKVDAETYVKKIQASLKRQNNMLLSVLMEDYLYFIEDLIDNTDIMNKDFFIVIPFYNNEFTKEAATAASKNVLNRILNFNKKSNPVVVDEKTLDKARKELRYRIQAVVEGLRACGVQSQPLGTQELIEMYYEFYNPETTLSQPLNNFDDMATPFVSKAGEYNHHEQSVKETEAVEENRVPAEKEAAETPPAPQEPAAEPEATANEPADTPADKEPQALEAGQDVNTDTPALDNPADINQEIEQQDENK
ncbi:hypothetical protein F4X86_03790 [Candidatus Saccharibacteria bacterium]|nr:hypothetical protein [Candidatus Saccharibacteria bacterium]